MMKYDKPKARRRVSHQARQEQIQRTRAAEREAKHRLKGVLWV